MAPELIEGSYTYKTDIWSVGVILYSMATGAHPFEGSSQQIVFEKILFEDYDKSKLEHKRCSEEVKDLINKLLIKEESNRLSIEEALEHPWFKLYETKDNYVLNSEIIESLKKFANVNLLHKEIMFYLAKISKDEEVAKLKQTFLELDKDNTGTLEFEEIISAIKKMGVKVEEVLIFY
jgi:calcium-dependent protein kinase